MGRGRFRQHPVVGHTPLHPEEWNPEHQQQHDDGQTDRHGPARHELRRPVPEQLLHRLAHRIRATEHPPSQPAHVQRVQPRPEQHDRRRCHHDRRHRDERHGGHAGVSEGLQEVHREQHHYRHRQRDGGRREQHGAARGGHGPDQRLVSTAAIGQLVAIAADDQQCVVDGQGQTQRAAEVQRICRDVGGEADQPQHRHRSDDGQPAQHDGQGGGQQPTENPNQHQKAQRNREGLHQQQVALVLVIDLGVDHRQSAGSDGDAVAVVHDLLGNGLGVVLRVVLAAFEVGHDQPGFAVLAHQIDGQVRRSGGGSGPRRGHVVDPGRPFHLVDDVGGDLAGLVALRAGRRGHQDHQLLIALPELVGQQVNGVRRLRLRVLKAAGGQTLGHREPEDCGGHHDQTCDREDSARRDDGKASDSLQHACPFRRLYPR